MEEEPKDFRACFIPIAIFIIAGLIGKLLFWIVEKGSNYFAVSIITIICVPLLLFIIGIIRGARKK